MNVTSCVTIYTNLNQKKEFSSAMICMKEHTILKIPEYEDMPDLVGKSEGFFRPQTFRH